MTSLFAEKYLTSKLDSFISPLCASIFAFNAGELLFKKNESAPEGLLYLLHVLKGNEFFWRIYFCYFKCPNHFPDIEVIVSPCSVILLLASALHNNSSIKILARFSVTGWL